jgi:hypothetical protein
MVIVATADGVPPVTFVIVAPFSAWLVQLPYFGTMAGPSVVQTVSGTLVGLSTLKPRTEVQDETDPPLALVKTTGSASATPAEVVNEAESIKVAR